MTTRSHILPREGALQGEEKLWIKLTKDHKGDQKKKKKRIGVMEVNLPKQGATTEGWFSIVNSKATVLGKFNIKLSSAKAKAAEGNSASGTATTPAADGKGSTPRSSGTSPRGSSTGGQGSSTPRGNGDSPRRRSGTSPRGGSIERQGNTTPRGSAVAGQGSTTPRGSGDSPRKGSGTSPRGNSTGQGNTTPRGSLLGAPGILAEKILPAAISNINIDLSASAGAVGKKVTTLAKRHKAALRQRRGLNTAYGEAETIEDEKPKERVRKKHRSLSDASLESVAAALKGMANEQLSLGKKKGSALQSTPAVATSKRNSIPPPETGGTPRNFKTDGSVRTFADTVGYDVLLPFCYLLLGKIVNVKPAQVGRLTTVV